MSQRIRFNTARQIYEAFPTLAAHFEISPDDGSPIEFLRKLATFGRRFDAIAFAACLLPRREAVWWGCQCVRALSAGRTDAALAAAEAWVRDPDDGLRRAALAIWQKGDRRAASTWLAFATGQSGGNIAPNGSPPRTPPAHMTAVGVKCAVILAIAEAPTQDQGAWKKACADAAVRFAEGGDAKVTPPFATRAGRAVG